MPEKSKPQPTDAAGNSHIVQTAVTVRSSARAILACMNAYLMTASPTFAGTTMMPSGSALVVESIGAWVFLLILLVLCGPVFRVPRRPLAAGDTARLRLLLMLILLTFAVRWASQVGAVGNGSDRAACMARCGVLGGIQAAHSDADGARCICRYP
jgi:hypothetical protein